METYSDCRCWACKPDKYGVTLHRYYCPLCYREETVTNAERRAMSCPKCDYAMVEEKHYVND
jgi:hypothetical protein